MQSMSFRIVFLTLLPAIPLDAQWSDRLYPFRELTDEMRARIDLRDGTVEDWSEVLGEPALTPLDFATRPSDPEYDPSSFDFRIWLAWHGAGNHLFVAAEIVDDIHVGMWPEDPPDWAPDDSSTPLGPCRGNRSFFRRRRQEWWDGIRDRRRFDCLGYGNGTGASVLGDCRKQ